MGTCTLQWNLLPFLRPFPLNLLLHLLPFLLLLKMVDKRLVLWLDRLLVDMLRFVMDPVLQRLVQIVMYLKVWQLIQLTVVHSLVVSLV